MEGAGAPHLRWKLACKSCLGQFQAIVTDFSSGRNAKKIRGEGEAVLLTVFGVCDDFIGLCTNRDSDEACERVAQTSMSDDPLANYAFSIMCNQIHLQ
jgi:hypothetical protein